MNDYYLAGNIGGHSSWLIAVRIHQRMLETSLGYLFILFAVLALVQVI